MEKKWNEVGVAERPMLEPPRAPDPAWQATLDQIAPRGRGMGGLHLYWEPGAGYWDVVNRWMIGQTVPPESTPDWMHEMLAGPDPRGFMYYDIVKREVIRAPDCPPISERQWLHYQLTGDWLTRYWCVQGPKGGHKLAWSVQEGLLLQLRGLPKEPPVPGSLPYTEPNPFTFDALYKGSRMRQFGYLLGKIESTGVLLDEEERQIATNMRRELWEWMEEQIGEVAGELAHALDLDMAPDAPGGGRDLPQKYEELKHEFITDEAIP